MIRFCRCQLRTTDVPAARAFYARVVDVEMAVGAIKTLLRP